MVRAEPAGQRHLLSEPLTGSPSGTIRQFHNVFPWIHDTSESSIRISVEMELQELLNHVQLHRHMCTPCALSSETSFAASLHGFDND